MRVLMYLTDNAVFDARLHQAGFRYMGDDATVRDAQKAARASRDQWVRRLQDAWRTPARDAAEPDASERLLRRISAIKAR